MEQARKSLPELLSIMIIGKKRSVFRIYDVINSAETCISRRTIGWSEVLLCFSKDIFIFIYCL
ncbi:hypothetical protein CVD28_11395 [Bacillus sp. M6-12]|nr:hypothetical protein CVD28_11395 [Bacillus sp. M6-12]